MTSGMETAVDVPSRPDAEEQGEPTRLAAVARTMGRLAPWRVWVAVTVVFAGSASVFFSSGAPFSLATVEALCGAPALDVRFWSSAAEVGSFLTACGQAGRVAYRNMQVADLFYPAVMGLFMASSLAAVLSRLAPRRPAILALAALPLVGTVLDYTENLFAWVGLVAYPEEPATNALLGIASAAKSTTFWIAGTVLLGAAIALAVAGVRRMIRVRAPGTVDSSVRDTRTGGQA